MKKTRINLAESHPHYFATAQPADSFAEVAEDDVKRLDMVESALAKVASLETENEALKGSEASVKESLTGLTDKVALLEKENAELQAKLDAKPGAEATVIGSDAKAEGDDKGEKKALSSWEQRAIERFQ
jgi:hypothetical protein